MIYFLVLFKAFPQHHAAIFPALTSPTAVHHMTGLGNPPCCTLFVANLARESSENELRDLFVEYVQSFFLP